MIRLNVFIRTTDSNREEVVNTAKELVAASLKDEGCVAYDLFESTTRNDVLMICPRGEEQNIKKYIDEVKFNKGEEYI